MAKSKIIKELANNEISIEVALNRLMIIASDLDNAELLHWIELELKGYGADDKLPKYRNPFCPHIVYSGVLGNAKITEALFPYPQIFMKDGLLNVRIIDGISAIQNALSSNGNSSYFIDLSYMIPTVSLKTNIFCTKLVQKIPDNHLETVISEVKFRIFNILLKLDKEYGCLDDLDINTSTFDTDKVQAVNQTINNYIYADNSIHIGDKNKLDGSTLAIGGDKDEV